MLSDRYHWLLQQWKKLQWSNKDIKSFREKLCDACAGKGKNKCALNDSEPYYGNLGSLQCLKQGQGDVAFMDWYAFEDALPRTGLKKEDFLLLCPDGNHVQASKIGAVKECNFGKVPSNALATCNMHDKVWRWKFAKALHYVKERSLRKFQGSIFGAKAEDLSHIPFANQTYQVWLGSNFLDAMEGTMQPTGMRNLFFFFSLVHFFYDRLKKLGNSYVKGYYNFLPNYGRFYISIEILLLVTGGDVSYPCVYACHGYDPSQIAV